MRYKRLDEERIGRAASRGKMIGSGFSRRLFNLLHVDLDIISRLQVFHFVHDFRKPQSLLHIMYMSQDGAIKAIMRIAPTLKVARKSECASKRKNNFSEQFTKSANS